ncbi:MAG: membrane dipeptidase, partial [Oscillospiraceae bacterium]|nr:membrane dipeptidase [Oscillospiraceae bacterium]
MEEIWKKGKIAIFFGFQNGSPLEDNLDYLEIFYRLGIRFIMLTYNKQNFIGCGGGESKDGGLTDCGKKVVKRMNELG